jgi:predicted PurR-regulated permease PerM|tara:strand:+ start:8872 stop:9144 length:273 start_codon:yes stop_codon:yes gene_type:complete
MIVEIVLGLTVVLLGVCSYIIWNLTRKVELLETWMEGFSNRILETSNNLQAIDSTGHFEADDEIGSIFEGIKDVINELTGSLGEQILEEE